jgi:OFA family oxalate/formate antiporter-like MFS transporter
MAIRVREENMASGAREENMASGAPGEREDGRYRWLAAAAGVLMQLALGAIYGWSVFVTPLEKLNGWTRTQVTLTFTIALFMLGLAAFGAGLWMDRCGPRVVGVTGGITYGLGVFLAGFSLHNLGLLYLSYGLLGGIGLGLGYIVPVATLVKWFPDKRGLVSGIAVAGFGGGAFFTALIAPGLIRAQGVLHTFMILGVLYFLLIVASACLLRNPPDGYVPSGWHGARGLAAGRATHDFTIGAALTTWQWYALWVILFLSIIPGVAVLSVAAAMAQDVARVGVGTAAGLVLINSVANVAGRLLWSSASDRIGCKTVFCAMFVVQAGALLVLPRATSFGLLTVCSFAIMLCNGGGFSTMPAFITDCFGARYVGQVYGLMLTAWGTAAIAGPLLMASVFDATRHYGPALHIFAVVMVAGALIPLLVRRPVARTAALPALAVVPAVGS